MTHIYNNHINEGGSIHLINAHEKKRKHIAPHERRALIHVEFSESDINLFKHIYGDEDEAMAAIHILMDAPAEIQILAIQLISFIGEVK